MPVGSTAYAPARLRSASTTTWIVKSRSFCGCSTSDSAVTVRSAMHATRRPWRTMRIPARLPATRRARRLQRSRIRQREAGSLRLVRFAADVVQRETLSPPRTRRTERDCSVGMGQHTVWAPKDGTAACSCPSPRDMPRHYQGLEVFTNIYGILGGIMVL